MTPEVSSPTPANDPPPRPRSVVLRDGTRAVLRRLVPSDEALLATGFEHLSRASRMRRFLSPISKLPPAALHYLSHPDQRSHLALALTTDPADGPVRGIGVARCVRLGENDDRAECAITVADEWQRRGAGSLLARALADWALAEGIRRWTGPDLEDNTANARLLASISRRVNRHLVGDGVVECECELRPSSDPA